MPILSVSFLECCSLLGASPIVEMETSVRSLYTIVRGEVHTIRRVENVFTGDPHVRATEVKIA